MTDAEKIEIIQQICEMSEENPVFLSNYSGEDLQKYIAHLENTESETYIAV